MLSIEFRKLLEALSQAGAEFIVVVGCAAVLQDVPIATFDLDIVHKRTPENIERLLSVLATLDAHFYPDSPVASFHREHRTWPVVVTSCSRRSLDASTCCAS